MKKIMGRKLLLLLLAGSLMFLNLPAYAASSQGYIKWNKLLTETYSKLFFVNNNYIIVGMHGEIGDKENSYVMKVSKDFKNWTTYDLGKNYFSSILFVKNAYWAVNYSGDVLTSKDLKTWVKTGTTARKGLMFYTGKQFVVVGGSCYISADGKKWSKAKFSIPFKGASMGQVLYTGKGFLFTGTNDTTTKEFYMTSRDGTLWTSAVGKDGRHIIDLAFDGSRYLAVRSDDRLYSSTDGLIWNKISSSRYECSALCYGNGKFIIKSGTKISVSKDGAAWESKNCAEDMNFHNIIWDGTKYCAISTEGGQFTSVDGLNWEALRFSQQVRYSKVIWNGAAFLAAGSNNVLLISRDGIEWTQKRLNIKVDSDNGTFNIKSIASDGKKYAALIEYQKISNKQEVYLSDDMENWKKVECPDFGYSGIRDIQYDGKNYIVVGGNSFISSDGVNWAFIKPRFEEDMNTIIYGGGKYVAAGYRGIVATSIDGIKWNTTKIDGVNNLFGLCYDGKQYIMNNYDDSIFTSNDGITWKQDDSFFLAQDSYTELKCVAYNGQRYVAFMERSGRYYIYVGVRGSEKVNQLKDSYVKIIIKGVK